MAARQSVKNIPRSPMMIGETEVNNKINEAVPDNDEAQCVKGCEADSHGDSSNAICSSLCSIHYSYANRK
ncbi:hypothetical protein PFISCL1PPCAC_21457 [Pristionchus fissidentatus]|uniref:Uncharacterized protein n=1 Tax=Pristionchus fissidentatus TaxID=1538716 RepID=A0AAV5WHV8_9BILA|nr:hypothetical protein PFISCL1PPCAC_21456 [Pristionchus fissidentatus]GMT30160.1 hypothetical protein PFISCL1PPCAC_21457 [Pristionchus fissidentatus]